MSYGGYNQYGGNPYGQEEAGYGQGGAQGGYGSSNPYGHDGAGQGYGSSNPYGGTTGTTGTTGLAAPPSQLQHEQSNYSQTSDYGANDAPAVPPVGSGSGPYNQQTRPPMSMPDFLARIEGVRTRMRELSTHISAVQAQQQKNLSSPDSSHSSQLDSLVNQTQILNTAIKDEIKYLEVDAKRSGKNATKDSQVRSVKDAFTKQLQQYRVEEQQYEERYRDQIRRQYRIVNPEATDSEVNEAANADWGNEGVFQTALKSNRTGHASSVLGAVRARHNDIQRIEATIMQLGQLFQDLAAEVEAQEYKTQEVEQQTQKVHEDTTNANVQLDKGISSARRARKLKWWTLGVVVLIILILALVLGLGFGVAKWGTSKAT